MKNVARNITRKIFMNGIQVASFMIVLAAGIAAGVAANYVCGVHAEKMDQDE